MSSTRAFNTLLQMEAGLAPGVMAFSARAWTFTQVCCHAERRAPTSATQSGWTVGIVHSHSTLATAPDAPLR